MKLGGATAGTKEEDGASVKFIGERGAMTR
jgi:hypothetical protein